MVSNRTRILTHTKASITTAVAWIAIVNKMSDKPQSRPGWLLRRNGNEFA
jgi:hypothetical protein